VALLDGGPVDAEVVDVALGACLSRERDLRLVHIYGSPGRAPAPLVEAFAREHVRGAMMVAHLVPGVAASAILIPAGTRDALRREITHAALVVTSVAKTEEPAEISRPRRGAGREREVIRVTRPVVADQLRLGYRLALLRELERVPDRDDGATTPEALDDAFHVGIASPPLSAETIRAWAACLAWPAQQADLGGVIPWQN